MRSGGKRCGSNALRFAWRSTHVRTAVLFVRKATVSAVSKATRTTIKGKRRQDPNVEDFAAQSKAAATKMPTGSNITSAMRDTARTEPTPGK